MGRLVARGNGSVLVGRVNPVRGADALLMLLVAEASTELWSGHRVFIRSGKSLAQDHFIEMASLWMSSTALVARAVVVS